MSMASYDAVVVGGGPSGATAATDLARAGRSVLLLDRAGRIKPCGGAIPPRLIRDFDIPDHLLVGRASWARMIGPSDRAVDMKVDLKGDGGFVGMVDREVFDEWLRERFVAMCEDVDVQQLLWPAYMNKELVYARPLAYARIFFKDVRHLLQTAN